MNYYNEIDPFAAEWLRALIKEGLIPNGEVDTRSIADVLPADLQQFTQCHFFAGIGGWSHALEIAGWPVDAPAWSGSCPCQPFSEAGHGAGKKDERHLWPEMFRLVSACRPSIVFMEQVPQAIHHGWLDDVSFDYEREGYSVGACVLSGCVVEARQERERLWVVACTDSFTPQRPTVSRLERHSWATEPSVDRLAYGLQNRMEQLRAYGNAIIPPLAAEVVKAFMETDHV